MWLIQTEPPGGFLIVVVCLRLDSFEQDFCFFHSYFLKLFAFKLFFHIRLKKPVEQAIP